MTETEGETLAEIEMRYILEWMANPRPTPPPVVRQTIHHSELPESPPGSAIATEANYYRREVGRLLAEGNEGRWVLIVGEQVVGIWDTQQEVYGVVLEQFPGRNVLIQQVLDREPVYRRFWDRPRWR